MADTETVTEEERESGSEAGGERGEAGAAGESPESPEASGREGADERDAADRAPNGEAEPLPEGVSEEKALELLREMLFYRRFEEKAEEAYAIGKIGGFCHLHIGQEAAAAGTIKALREQDRVVTAYRDHTQALAKGVEARAVMAELYGRKSGTSGGKGGSMHIFDASLGFMGGHGIVGGQVPLAAGMAFADRYRDEDRLCLCFMGDAAVNQGAFHEAMNMSAVWKLPVIYAVENNEYGMGTAFSRVSATHVHERACAYGIPAHEVDGQDVIAVHTLFNRLVEEVAGGSGPHYVDIQTYRFKGHSMSDPVSGTYRSKEEVQERREKDDPISLLRDRLFALDLLTQEELEAIDAEVKEIVDAAADFADDASFPGGEDLYSHVYAEINEHGRLFFDGREDAPLPGSPGSPGSPETSEGDR